MGQHEPLTSPANYCPVQGRGTYVQVHELMIFHHPVPASATLQTTPPTMNTMESSSELNNNGDDDVSSSCHTETWCISELLYQFHGFWFTKTYLETTRKVLQNFKPLPTDVILASFPKTGTTWLKALLHSITHRSQKDDLSLVFNHPQELVPSLETNLYVREGSKTPEFLTVKNTEKRRILATHIPYQILYDILNSSECKIVYVTRNPKDTLVSLWHFLQTYKIFEQDPWELDAAVDHFCKGIVPFGSYYDHVLAYREESLERPQKVFFITYEELKENPKEHVKKLAQFLECPFEGEIGEVEVEKIVKMCSFEVLRNQGVNKSSELPDSFPLPYNSFYRKAEVGDHLNYLTEEEIKKIDTITRARFHTTGFVYGI